MMDVLKKAMLAGIGIASLTMDKVEELTKEVIDKGNLSEQEGEKFLQDIQKRAEESREAMRQQIDRLVESTIGRMQLARISDLEKLQAEIEGLRKEIEALRLVRSKDESSGG